LPRRILDPRLVQLLPVSQLFPLVDMWRLGLLDSAVGDWLAAQRIGAESDPINVLLKSAIPALANNSPDNPRNYILTILRMLCNAFTTAMLVRRLTSSANGLREDVTTLLIATLLHEDGAVRTAAASLVFNVAAWIQKGRVESVRAGTGGNNGQQEDDEWGVEIVSAVVEALEREKVNEEVVHRLTASLAFLIRLSPYHESSLNPLLDVLQAKSILNAKLAKGGCGESGVTKKEVRKLIEETAGLCP